ncbi:MAG: prepilin-type N-terminal cleavage/methylation domain-containing protein [Erysipelotrichaceae bacterium]
MKKLKQFKNDVKGFTLVEIIVVLLIIAILAAISIPTMIGYVNEARESEYIAQARTAYVAAQTVAIKRVAKEPGYNVKRIVKKDVKDYLGTNSKVDSFTIVTFEKEVITKIAVRVANEYEVTFQEDKEVVVKKDNKRP